MPKIYDNIENPLKKGLEETLEVSQRTDFCVGYFNLRGWKEISEKIDGLEGSSVAEGENDVHRVCRLLVGMQKAPIEILRDYHFKDKDYMMDQAEAFKLKKRMTQEFKCQLEMGPPNEKDENGLRKLSQQMKDKKVVVKLHLAHTLHAKLYLAYSSNPVCPVVGFLGSSNLTFSGLVKQGELNIDVLDQDAANKLADWFDARWSDRWSLDITEELIDIIDNSWAADRLVSPFHIYLKIAYHLSREARAGMNEFKLPKVFEEKLFEFQQKAVLVAARHLNKRGGVLIGDVVGLGKTFTATALAKIFEDDFSMETLILCPKNLVEMWEGYAHTYQLRAKVLSQSMVQSKLPDLRRYRIVIIDESHNLRNDQGSRYRAIKAYLEKNDSKVILLSATPYNKTYLDLSNQLRLFISDDKDLGISPERYIESIGGQVQFNSKHTETLIRSIKAFEKSAFSDDWRELMRLYLVRRTRSFIKNNYAQTDPKNNRKYLIFPDSSRSYFPDRLAKKVQYKFDPQDANDQYAKMYSIDVVNIINDLELPRYGLQQYLPEEPSIKASNSEALIMKNLSRAGRRLMGFCRTNLFKRLESSGYSFLLSLSRHILRNYLFIYALQNDLPIPIGKNISQNLDDYLEDGDTDNEQNEHGDEENDNGNENAETNKKVNKDKILLNFILDKKTYLQKAEKLYEIFESDKYEKQFDWVRSEFFNDFQKMVEETVELDGKKHTTKKLVDVSLLKSLLSDSEKIIQILEIGKDWNPDEDRQLNALYHLLTNTHKKEKVLVFTQFADTAHYLTNQLKKRNVTKIESVTGSDKSPTGLAHRFSPHSNEKKDIADSDQELRILITTDVLSEGQNLQDGHIILNYDLPWAIIRLIQRAGRVDRIGQKADQILCYSFLPEKGLENILRLRERLIKRIEENANVVGSDETFFVGDPINIEDLYSEKSGILDGDDDDTEVDLASYAYQIWKNASDADPKLRKLIPDLPNVIYATKHNEEAIEKEGVIVYTRTSEENDVLAWVDNQGKIITQSQYTILKAAQCAADTKPENKLENHHELVTAGIDFIHEEEKNTGGSLGKKSGEKYRVYTRLDAYCKGYENTLFANEELKKAIDDIYQYPLKEEARDTLNRQLKAGISDEQLAKLVVSLREDDKLAIINDYEQTDKEFQIICSLGLTNR